MQQQGSCGAGVEGLWALLTFPYLYSLLEELVEISEPRHDVVPHTNPLVCPLRGCHFRALLSQKPPWVLHVSQPAQLSLRAWRILRASATSLHRWPCDVP